MYSLSFYSYDFRDTNGSINLRATLDAQSNKLPFNIFDKEWKEIPAHKRSNDAFGQVYADAYVDYDGLKFGVFGEKLAQVDINEGFFQTLFYAKKDFFQLLLNKDIYKTMQENPINGKATSYNSYGVYVQKVFKPKESHFISLKLKLHYANQLHDIKVNGYTDNTKFIGNFDYYYSQKNLISKRETQSDTPRGIGYGLDLEYIYQKDKWYFYIGGYNLGSNIYWKNVTLMHYEFNSEVVYKGTDGYNHYRPFGKGQYKYNLTFKQKLPQYYKTSLNYEVAPYLSIGTNIKIYEKLYVTEPYINAKLYFLRYKLGYQLQDNTLLFALYYKYFNLEISNKFSPSNDALQAQLKISF